jgi:hypothetical protein
MKRVMLLMSSVLLLALSACQQHAMSGNVTTVRITASQTPNGKPTVDKPRVILSRGAGDEIEWDAGGKEFVVTFADSPFKSHYFHESRKRSGKGQKTGPYEYKVLIDGQELDPSVIIKD